MAPQRRARHCGQGQDTDEWVVRQGEEGVYSRPDVGSGVKWLRAFVNVPSERKQLLIAQGNFNQTRLSRRFLRPNNGLWRDGIKTVAFLSAVDRQKRTTDAITIQQLSLAQIQGIQILALRRLGVNRIYMNTKSLYVRKRKQQNPYLLFGCIALE